MAAEISIRQGNTNGIAMYLLADSVAIDLSTAERVVLVIKGNDGITTTHDSDVTTSGCVITTPASGLVTFYPYNSTTYTTSINFVASKSPYVCYIWVYPSAAPSLIKYSVPESNNVKIWVISE